jgi:CTP synthase (UTP-ammonia lyase)
MGQGKLRPVGINDKGALRVVELEGHRFFVASLFLPQMSSSPERPHAMIDAYLKGALQFRHDARA